MLEIVGLQESGPVHAGELAAVDALWLSSGDAGGVDLLLAVHGNAVDLASEVALQRANDLELGMALGNAASDIGLGPVIRSQASDSDDVQGTVRGPVPAPV